MVDESPVLAELKQLEELGVRLIACGTRLSYYELTDKLAIGILSGMPDIIEDQLRALKVITI